MKTVVVTIDGGVIQGVEVPPGVRVVIYDYDTEGVDQDDVEYDDKNDPRLVSIWE